MTARLTLPAVLALVTTVGPLAAAEPNIDLSRAVVISASDLAKPAAFTEQAVRMLVEEVDKRSMIFWERIDAWPPDKTPVIVIGLADGVHKLLDRQGVKHAAPAAKPASEGYQIGVSADRATPIVWVAGNDGRGYSSASAGCYANCGWSG